MRRRKILTLALFVGAMLLLAATGALLASLAVSNSHPTLDKPTPDSTITPTVTVTNPVAAMIARFLGLDYTMVQTWHDEGIGYGNMTIALFVAQASCEASEDDCEDIEPIFGQIMDLRRQEEGGGWGYIIKELELDIKRRDTNLGAVRSGREEGTTSNPPFSKKNGPARSWHLRLLITRVLTSLAAPGPRSQKPPHN